MQAARRLPHQGYVGPNGLMGDKDGTVVTCRLVFVDLHRVKFNDANVWLSARHIPWRWSSSGAARDLPRLIGSAVVANTGRACAEPIDFPQDNCNRKSERPFSYLHDLVAKEWESIRFHAAGSGCLINEIRELFFRQPIGTKRLDGQLLAHVGDPCHGIVSGRIIFPCKNLCDCLIACNQLAAWSPLPHCTNIHAQRMRENSGTERSVMGVKHATKRGGKTVDGTQARIR